MPAAARKLTSGVGFNPNRNGDGTFAAGQHAEADLELDVAQDPAADAPPTDPHELIAFHDQQRETDSAQLDELWKTGCGTGQFETYEQAKDDFNGDEFRRYQDLARAVRGAPTSAATKAGG